MFAYVIIGIELAILYLVFWVVFIREPRPIEIRAELWGNYADSSDGELLANAEQSRLPPFVFADQEKLNSYLPSRFKIRSYRRANFSKSRHRRLDGHSSCTCLCHEKTVAVNIAGWRGQTSLVMSSEKINKKLAERFLLALNRTLNTLSVKVP